MRNTQTDTQMPKFTKNNFKKQYVKITVIYQKCTQKKIGFGGNMCESTIKLFVYKVRLFVVRVSYSGIG